MRATVAAVLCCLASAAAAQPAGTHEAAAIRAFIEKAGPTCAARPARACIDLAWNFAAPSPQGLTLEDAQSVRQRLGAWYAQAQDKLPARERGSLALGLALADGIGIERLHAAFDADGDGRVTKEELLADVRLDHRPLGDVLADPGAVNRASLSRRLGVPPALLDALYR